MGYINQCLASGEGFQVDILNYHKSGHAYWVQIDCSPLFDDKGELQGYLALQVDITDQKHTAQLLDEKTNLFECIVETMNDGVITIDGEGSILSTNNAAQVMFQYSNAETLGLNIKCLMPEEYARVHDQYLQKHRHTGQNRVLGKSRQLAGQRKDGSVFPLEISITETVKNNQSLFIGLLKDITSRKAYEDQIEQLAFTDALTQLATGGCSTTGLSIVWRSPLGRADAARFSSWTSTTSNQSTTRWGTPWATSC